MDGFCLLLAFVIVSIIAWYDLRKKRSKTTKQVNSFSKCSTSEWSYSDISCSDDSGVINITITSRQ